MADERCFCHLNGLMVKDAVARAGMAEAIARASTAEASITDAIARASAAEASAAEATNRASAAAAVAADVAKKVSVKAKTEAFRYYVKKSGNDENDGKTEDTAFQTMDKFFSLLNEGNSEIRCYITEPGVYDVSCNLFNFVALHITGSVDGVILNFTEDDWSDGIVFYNSHINLQNLTFRAYNEGVRFESGVTTLENIVFECNELRLYQTHIECTTSLKTPIFIALGSCGRLKNLEITSASGSSIAFDRGCNIRLYGNIYLPEREVGNEDIIFNCQHSVVYINPGTITGSGWATGIRNYSSLIVMPQFTYDQLAAVCNTPIFIDDRCPGVFIKSGSVIGGDYT